MDSLTKCTWRFFVNTYNIALIDALALMLWRMLTVNGHSLSLLGFFAGVFVYRKVEALAHKRMHQHGSVFHKTHWRHHVLRTPESGLPPFWVYVLYCAVTVLLFRLNLPFLTGFYFAVLLMLTAYEYIHFLCHCNYKPKTECGRRIRVNHLQHHGTGLENTRYEMLFLNHGKS